MRPNLPDITKTFYEELGRKFSDTDGSADYIYDNNIAICYRGSITHGLYVPATEANSTDDVDIIAVTVGNDNEYLGVNNATDSIEFWAGRYDIVSYDIRKFIGLISKCNPNVISMLWLDELYFIDKEPIFDLLVQNRMRFVNTRKVYDAFSGYAYSQLKKMESGKNLGYMGEKRKTLVEKFGYDTKNASHLIRLLKMGIEFLSTGALQVDRTTDHQELLDIKNGAYGLAKIKNMAESMFIDMKNATNNSVLGDYEITNKELSALSTKIIMDTWKNRREL